MGNPFKAIISFVTTYSGSGAVSAQQGIKNVQGATNIASRGLATLGSTLGGMDGKFGRVAQAATGMMQSIATMGVIGGIMSGVQLAITAACDHIKKKYDEMAEAAERAFDRMKKRMDAMNKKRMDEVGKALDAATTKAQAAAKAFDAMAAAYLKVERAKNDSAKSADSAAISGMELAKSRAMAGAKSDNERATIGAGWDEKIARAKLAATQGEQADNVGVAEKEAKDARARARASRQTERLAKAALEKANRTHEEDVNANNDANAEKSKQAVADAERAYADAVNDRIAKVAEATAADKRLTQAKNAQQAAVNEATRVVVEAEAATKILVESQRKAAQAELDKIDADKKAAAERRKKEADEERRKSEEALSQRKAQAISAGEAQRDKWQGEFNAAFDLWRDPEAAKQAVEADKQRADDMKRFRKDVNRYGGKGKIDEYAKLMREGDEEGMQDRLTQWRKSSKFTPQVEQMVKAAAADQNKQKSEKALDDIAKNTADLAKKLDELMSLK